jgi:hypothetical protein
MGFFRRLSPFWRGAIVSAFISALGVTVAALIVTGDPLSLALGPVLGAVAGFAVHAYVSRTPTL